MKKVLRLFAAALAQSPAYAALIYDESMFPGGDFLPFSNPDSYLSIATLGAGVNIITGAVGGSPVSGDFDDNFLVARESAAR